MEKYGTAGQATDETKIRRMSFACGITKATGTHSEYVPYCFSTETMVNENALQYYVYTYVACLVKCVLVCFPYFSVTNN